MESEQLEIKKAEILFRIFYIFLNTRLSKIRLRIVNVDKTNIHDANLYWKSLSSNF